MTKVFSALKWILGIGMGLFLFATFFISLNNERSLGAKKEGDCEPGYKMIADGVIEVWMLKPQFLTEEACEKKLLAFAASIDPAFKNGPWFLDHSPKYFGIRVFRANKDETSQNEVAHRH